MASVAIKVWQALNQNAHAIATLQRVESGAVGSAATNKDSGSRRRHDDELAFRKIDRCNRSRIGFLISVRNTPQRIKQAVIGNGKQCWMVNRSEGILAVWSRQQVIAPHVKAEGEGNPTKPVKKLFQKK